jgi:hypothetical protein
MAITKVGTLVGGLSGLASGIAQNFGLGTRKGGDSFFNVEQFKSQISEGYGLFKPTLFYVTIGVPKFTLDIVEDDTQREVRKQNDPYGSEKPAERLRFLCSSASLPGVQIITSDHRRQNMGTFDRRPFGVQVTDIPLTFMLDGRGFVLKYFNQWANAIVNADLRNGERGESVVKGQGLYEIGYRDSYVTDITITTLTGTSDTDKVDSGKEAPVEIVTYTLREAFPIQIGDVSVAWNATDQFSTLPIPFTFRGYDIKQMATGRATSSREFSMAEWLGLLGTSFNIGSQIYANGLPNTIGGAVNLFTNSGVRRLAQSVF